MYTITDLRHKFIHFTSKTSCGNRGKRFSGGGWGAEPVEPAEGATSRQYTKTHLSTGNEQKHTFNLQNTDTGLHTSTIEKSTWCLELEPKFFY